MALVEFALVIPVLLAMVLGIIEFGLLEKDALVVSNAAREGIRYAALGNGTTEVKSRIKNAAATLNPALTDSQITLEQTTDRTGTAPTYSAWPADATATSPARNGVAAGSLIRITVAYPHQSLTGFFPFLRNRTVTTRVVMGREASG